MVDTSSNNLPLRGKHALVTGATRGIGLETCRQLAALGAYVIVAARDLARAEAVAQALRDDGREALALKLDVTSEADRAAVFRELDSRFGKLDILINNAGIWLDSADAATPPDRPIDEVPESVVRRTFEVNFFAPLLLTQTLLPLLKQAPAARVVNVSSIRGSLAHLSDPASPVYPVKALGYDTSKAALNAFTILLAEQLRGSPIKINAIHPGWVRTEMGSKHADLGLEDGARTAIRYATLGEDGPTGGFFFQDERLPW
ncbi:SDR family NAD(P)-dependent oxidoreductase [Paraburkholderia caballeronis]|uniref:Short-chain dehydrogenase n=1 Tax=Paraburkholderia caballeronis TaxID=416943 RepID=A0A1H7T1H3_9BURK|nr:SDR family NAD(P)-dependent oxidoreductase [Paraburkholderia caballeronis]PXW25740.1 short-subunit dehydrogenase [Paraburkholderia caballeronis]PXX01347.1 short-subunit dehydrogenase [Paraburkholderia caballeronis]RAJ99299.1 short-subunit dehydrogenase [Paraburkholderia caballeronis]TDV33814.1 short-subunit dehydrogenase [Paraburkholderia caballeronis]SEE24489.1 Short-chain dehydrogenase [Paraburkholderia caballeronis]